MPLRFFYEFVAKAGCQLSYLLTYKLSQDHLELFFAAVRGRGGFNNNQFEAAYKRLLLRNEVKVSGGNCTAFEPATVPVSTITQTIEDSVPDEQKYMLVARRYGLENFDKGQL